MALKKWRIWRIKKSKCYKCCTSNERCAQSNLDFLVRFADRNYVGNKLADVEAAHDIDKPAEWMQQIADIAHELADADAAYVEQKEEDVMMKEDFG